jgi:hypothetical protein
MPLTDQSEPIWTIRHLVAALGNLSVDSAREFTYLDCFPKPRAGFARNLWLREDVLA